MVHRNWIATSYLKNTYFIFTDMERFSLHIVLQKRKLQNIIELLLVYDIYI